MLEIRKRLMAWVLAAAMVLTGFIATPQTAQAAVSLPTNAETIALDAEVVENVNIEENGEYSAWYKVHLDSSKIIQFVLSATDDGWKGLYIYDNAGNSVGWGTGDGKNKDARFYEGLLKGDYYISVQAHPYVFKSFAGQLTLSCITVDPDKNNQSFVEEYDDVPTRNNTIERASVLQAGNKYRGIIGPNNDTDWYKLTLNGNASVQFSEKVYSEYSTNIARMYLYNSDRSKRLMDLSDAFGNLIKETTIPAGDYFIEVTGSAGYCNASYLIDISPSSDGSASEDKAAAPKLKKVKAAKGAIVAKVKNLGKADGYEIQVSTNNDFSDAKTSSYAKSVKKAKITGLSSGTTYYVRARSYKTKGGEKVYSDWSVSKKTTVK